MGGVSNTSYTAETWTVTNGSLDTTGGYIYGMNLTGQEKTYRWVGLWGNATGETTLRTASNNFYTWSMAAITADSVLYATTNITGIYTSAFQGTNTTSGYAHLAQADAAYSYDSGVIDSINNTYDSSGSFQSPSMTNPVYVNTTSVDSWTNYMVPMQASISTTHDIAWAVTINPGQTAFNGQKADYELLIPENEESGDGEGVVTTYYLWMELN